MDLSKKKISQIIKEKALELGFENCGISRAENLDQASLNLKYWLDNGYHAEMKYMETHFEKRVNPQKLVEGAKSVVSVILNYYPQEKQASDTFQVSKYAYGEDYHFTVKRKLKTLFSEMKLLVPEMEGRVFVDSAPVLERDWAARSGLGWIGKHSLLISKEYGSYVFIGEMIINLELAYDTPINEYCGTCTRCIDACPTKAIVEPKVVDANKCISYHTIENKESIDEKLKGKFNGYIFGCDICQDVCPWNKNRSFSKEESFSLSNKLKSLTRKEWIEIDEKTFNGLFKDSPLKRTKFSGIKRNIEFITEE